MAAGFSKLLEAKKYLFPSFSGRITFEEYTRAMFWVVLFGVIFFSIFGVLFLVLMNASSKETALIGCSIAIIIGFIAILPVFLSLLARRLHDAGYSANYLWLFLLCGIGGIIAAIFATGDTVGDNEYGPGDPNYQGGKFSDLKRSANMILHPESRMTLKEYGLAGMVLGWIYNAVYMVISPIMQLASIPAALNGNNMDDPSSYSQTALAGPSLVLSLILFAAVIIYYIFYLRISISRLHDTGRSGLLFFLILLCGIGVIIPLICCMADSDDDNQYGNKKDNDDFGNSFKEDPFTSSNHSMRDECEE